MDKSAKRPLLLLSVRTRLLSMQPKVRRGWPQKGYFWNKVILVQIMGEWRSFIKGRSNSERKKLAFLEWHLKFEMMRALKPAVEVYRLWGSLLKLLQSKQIGLAGLSAYCTTAHGPNSAAASKKLAGKGQRSLKRLPLSNADVAIDQFYLGKFWVIYYRELNNWLDEQKQRLYRK